jgi:glycogen debranching enzyme
VDPAVAGRAVGVASSVSEVIRVRDQYYILATSPLADTQTRVLKQGETFAIFDLYGDIRRLGRGEQGVYHKGTRHISRSVLQLGGERPLLLGSSVAEDNIVFAVDLTNPDMTIGGVFVPRGTLHIFRSIFLWDGSCYQRVRLFNYGEQPLDVELTIALESDFVDIFEVRGVKRAKRGVVDEVTSDGPSLVMRYEGLDGVERRTRVTASSDGVAGGSDLQFRTHVPSQTPCEIFVTSAFEEGAERRTLESYPSAIVHQREAQKRLISEQCEISTSNELFNAWLNRSIADLRMMITDTGQGPFPFAGVPWYSCPFGRDALITAYEMLWVEPSLARGVLGYLAATQATEVDPDREAEPGKILHEMRRGEMAVLNEIPFGNYYGSIDSTPLFVALAGEYMAHTGDVAFVESIWGNIEAALEWMDRYGDKDGDGFLEYRGSERGLVQQGWKDSHDSVFHADGRIPPPPIALCEVQGYAFWAKRGAASMARELGFAERADVLEKQALALQEAFERMFWSDEIGMYALALDGDKRPCLVRASNAGHCLLTGIAAPERARLVASALTSDAFSSGWGIRTLATSEVRYGPITYHNGSVWPHDNALIGQGLANYGYRSGVHEILAGLLDATEVLEFHRLPELYCGFPRRPGQGPVEYPLACAPQAWAAGSIFLLLRASLGLSVDAAARRVVLTRPTLPPFLSEMQIKGLRAGTATLDLSLQRYAADVVTSVTKREGDVELVTVK